MANPTRCLRTSYNLAPVLRELNRARVTGPEGQPAFDAFVYDSLVPVIWSATSLRVSLSQHGRVVVIGKAIDAAFKTGPLTPESLNAALVVEQKRYLKQRKKEFLVVTRMSLKFSPVFRSRKIGSASFMFSSHLPSQLRTSREALSGLDSYQAKAAPGSEWVRIKVLARHPGEAVEFGLDSLDTLRGIWAVALTKGARRRSFGPRLSPLNPLVTGPVYSVHNMNGTAALDTFWSPPNYSQPSAAADLADKWREVVLFESKVRARLRTVPYKRVIEEGFRRYAQALDGTDWDSASLKLWSLIESLTSDGVADYDKIIRRTSFIFHDPELELQLLHHIKDYRNAVVHRDASSRDSESIMCEVKRYAGDLLIFHVANGKDFATIEQAGTFLDLPPDQRLLRKALRFLGSENAARRR
jgi:hypothetical protein